MNDEEIKTHEKIDNYLNLPSYNIFDSKKKKKNSPPEHQIKHTLTKEDLEKCYEIGTLRKNLHKGSSKTIKDSPTRDISGMCGECGFGRIKNLEPDWSLRPSGDEYDFFINGNYIDCKSTEYVKYMKVKVSTMKPYKHWIYVFCKVNITTGEVVLVGWMTGDVIASTTKSYPYKKNQKEYFYKVSEHRLNSMKDFDEYVSICRKET